jgi:hypothetical protein
VPPGAPIGHFANNDRWHDDVSDGPVSATVTPPGGSPVVVQASSWVVVAPPDFAPGIDSMVTLYDIALQSAITKGTLRPEDKPSFTRHIRPMIERLANMRWIDRWTEWENLQPLNWNALADPGAASRPLRESVAKRIQHPGLDHFELPTFLSTYVDQWAAGTFISVGSTPAALSVPEQLDRAALSHGSGNNFYPGIEGGQNLKHPSMYGEPFRLDVANTALVYPGCLTEIMAVPWQADFYACHRGAGAHPWWPSQRPDQVMTDPGNIPGSKEDWEKPITNYAGMIDNVLRLGFVVAHGSNEPQVFVETERDLGFPRQP